LEAYDLKPLVDGKALASALSIKPGPWMKDALDVVMAWQLRNPDIKDPQAAVDQVKRSHEAGGELTVSLIDHFLRLTIRPLFQKAKRPEITTAGRKNTKEGIAIAKQVAWFEENSLWKNDVYVLDLLCWVLRSLDTHLIEKHWPMLLPPILTLIDDHETHNKATGCRLLSTLLRTTPPSLLKKTGLGPVFEEALLPCLTFLPQLTSVDESIEILNAAYPALIQLSRVQSPIKPPSTIREQQSKENTLRLTEVVPSKARFLDRILRQGILTGYLHAGDNPRIATVLFTHLAALIQELGIDSVKHLKDVLPLLSNVLSDPLGAAHPPLLMAAVKAIQACVLNAWPRMDVWRGEVLRGLAGAWLTLENEDSEDVGEVRRESAEILAMLVVAVKGKVNLEKDLQSLVEADGRLRELFDRAMKVVDGSD